MSWRQPCPILARLGTSSWTCPGWTGLVWDTAYSDAMLSKPGLSPYAQHPLLRAVSLDRAFYRPLSAAQYAAYAAQVGDDFRFTIKAPALVTDATARSETDRAVQPNPMFLNAEPAVQSFFQPALEGLGSKLGALEFQISPLPQHLLANMPELLERLGTIGSGSQRHGQRPTSYLRPTTGNKEAAQMVTSRFEG